jgi:hypothetical protein
MDFKSAKLNPFSYNLYYVKWYRRKEVKIGSASFRGNYDHSY